MIIYICATDESNALELAGADTDSDCMSIEDAKDEVDLELCERVFKIEVTEVK